MHNYLSPHVQFCAETNMQWVARLAYCLGLLPFRAEEVLQKNNLRFQKDFAHMCRKEHTTAENEVCCCIVHT